MPREIVTVAGLSFRIHKADDSATQTYQARNIGLAATHDVQKTVEVMA